MTSPKQEGKRQQLKSCGTRRAHARPTEYKGHGKGDAECTQTKQKDHSKKDIDEMAKTSGLKGGVGTTPMAKWPTGHEQQPRGTPSARAKHAINPTKNNENHCYHLCELVQRQGKCQ